MLPWTILVSGEAPEIGIKSRYIEWRRLEGCDGEHYSFRSYKWSTGDCGSSDWRSSWEGRPSLDADCGQSGPVTVEVVVLGSVSVTCSATKLRTMEAALIHGLYLLDGKLAEGQFRAVLDG